MKILQVEILVVFLSLHRISGRISWRDVGQCGSGLACGPECQKLCLTQHNYYRALHNLSPVRCDPELAESAQAWTDLQAQKSHIKRSPWRNLGQVVESISWKKWGWKGMADTRGAVPGAVRSWYSEKKGSIVNRTATPEHYHTIVRPDITRLGCGIHVIPGDGTYVTSHYGTMPGGNLLNDEIQIPAARDPEPACQVKSGQREKCGNISSPYVTPDVCLKASCCYDDIFRDEPDVNWYSSEGSTWCYKGKQAPKTDDMETQNEDNNETNVNTSMVTETENDFENQNSLENNGANTPPTVPSGVTSPTPQPPHSSGTVASATRGATADATKGATTGAATGASTIMARLHQLSQKTTEKDTAVGNNKVFSVARYSDKGNKLQAENFFKNVPPLI